MISGVFARTFRSAVQPVEIASALNREVDNSAQILSRDRRLVPNNFHVELSATDHEQPRGARPAAPPRADRDAARARRAAVLRLHRPGQHLPGDQRRPDHRPLPGPQPGDRERQPLRGRPHRHPGTPGHRDPRCSTASTCRSRHPASSSAAATTPTCASTTRASPASTSRSGWRSPRTPQTGPRITVHDLGSTNGVSVNGKRVDQATSRRRCHDQDRQHHHVPADQRRLSVVRADARADPVRLPGDPVDLRALVHLGDPLGHVRRPGGTPAGRADPLRAPRPQARQARQAPPRRTRPTSSSWRAATRVRRSPSTRPRC